MHAASGAGLNQTPNRLSATVIVEESVRPQHCTREIIYWQYFSNGSFFTNCSTGDKPDEHRCNRK